MYILNYFNVFFFFGGKSEYDLWRKTVMLITGEGHCHFGGKMLRSIQQPLGLVDIVTWLVTGWRLLTLQ